MTAKLCVARGECDHESCGDWLPPAAPPSEQTLDPLIVMLSTALGGSVALFSKVALCTRNPPSDPGVTCELAGPARPSVTATIASDVRRMIGRASRIVEFIVHLARGVGRRRPDPCFSGKTARRSRMPTVGDC